MRGTPAYLQTIQSDQPLQTNIIEGILTRETALCAEVHFVLQQKLRESRNHFALL
jgi:hypothetical protein